VKALDAVGIVLLLCCAYLLAVFVRRRLIARAGGVVEMSLHGRHWRHGFARYEGGHLAWFRTFSLSPRAACDLPRRELRVIARREPHGAEALALVHDAVVLTCQSDDEIVELAVPPTALLGLLSWLEAAPMRVSRG
jgi:hypothetical protein